MARKLPGVHTRRPDNKHPTPKELTNWQQFCILTAVLTIVLSYLHKDSFNPSLAQWNNDHPLGLIQEWQRAPTEDMFSREWSDNNWLGFDGQGRPPSFTWLLLWVWKFPILVLVGAVGLLFVTGSGIYYSIKQLIKK